MTTLSNPALRVLETRAPASPASAAGQVGVASWYLMGAVALASRLVLGWIYWGGASRRFIYDVEKIHPASPGYLANKLVHAAPGMPFGLDGLMHWVLSQHLLLQVSVIGFSIVELLVGIGLLLGLGTRLWALIGLGLAAFLMVVFGWMGSTCLDEWTMAACDFAMAAVVLVAGSGPYSLDQVLIRNGAIARRPWLAWLTSGPLPIDEKATLRLTTLMGVLSIVFTVVFYGFNFDAIYSPLGKRVDNAQPHIALSDAMLTVGNHLNVDSYINAGPDTQGFYVAQVALAPVVGGKIGAPLLAYDAAALHDRTVLSLHNRFAPWSGCASMAYAVRCQLGSQAHWTLTVPIAVAETARAAGAAPLMLILTDVEGRRFTVPVQVRTNS